MRTIINTTALDALYHRYHHKEFVHPDPLEFLYNYDGIQDREIAGLLASSLAYGRVAQILKNVAIVLQIMNPSPYLYIKNGSDRRFQKDFESFQYRFTTAHEMQALLKGVRRVLNEFESLEQCMAQSMPAQSTDVADALPAFAAYMNGDTDCGRNSLMPHPECGSACKRLNLFLRWMVRCDNVDPGGWNLLKPGQLIIPLDTHMHRFCKAMGLTHRKSADLRTAREITAAFRTIAPHDPARYDFSITRLGIRGDEDPEEFLRAYHAGAA